MRIFSLPSKTKKLEEDYLNLKIGSRKINCPYYQNLLNKKVKLVFAGKGLPLEIEKEMVKIFRQKNQMKLLKKLTPETIRLYLLEADLGIDCSGLVANLLNSFFEEKGLGSLWKFLKFPTRNPIRLIFSRLKPRSHTSASILTHSLNCVPINLDQTKPADLLKVGTGHVALIDEVETDNNGRVKRIGYVHSTSDYLDKYGVRKGKIIITNKEKPLEKQQWNETYRGENWMLKDFLNAPPEEKGIRRLRFLNQS